MYSDQYPAPHHTVCVSLPVTMTMTLPLPSPHPPQLRDIWDGHHVRLPGWGWTECQVSAKPLTHSIAIIGDSLYMFRGEQEGTKMWCLELRSDGANTEWRALPALARPGRGSIREVSQHHNITGLNLSLQVWSRSVRCGNGCLHIWRPARNCYWCMARVSMCSEAAAKRGGWLTRQEARAMEERGGTSYKWRCRRWLTL